MKLAKSFFDRLGELRPKPRTDDSYIHGDSRESASQKLASYRRWVCDCYNLSIGKSSGELRDLCKVGADNEIHSYDGFKAQACIEVLERIVHQVDAHNGAEIFIEVLGLLKDVTAIFREAVTLEKDRKVGRGVVRS